jgi:lysozyme family protein
LPPPFSSERSPLNRQAKDFPGLVPDGRVGPATLAALDKFLALRGPGGIAVLMRALEAMQGERYLRLAEKRPANEAFLYGWLANRIVQADGGRRSNRLPTLRPM